MGLSPTVASASAPSVTLQFWNTYNTTDKEFSTMQKWILKKFEKENPGIKVVSVRRALRVTPGAKFIAAAAAGNPPALLRSDIAWVPSLAADGVLLNLTAPEVGAADLEGCPPRPAVDQLLRRQLLRDPR